MAAKYVKLGPKASFFYDPTTKTKVTKGDIVEIKGITKFSKKLNSAISGGHLSVVTAEEYKRFKKEGTVEEIKDFSDKSWVSTWDDFDEESLNELTVPKLVELAIYLELSEDEKVLLKMRKAELIKEIIDSTEEDEEDEED